MAQDVDKWIIVFLFVGFIYTIIVCFYNLNGYYKSVTIPDTLINIIQHNLESTPIMDILFDDQCDNDNTSNILRILLWI